jgi:MoxR-like ATPase
MSMTHAAIERILGDLEKFLLGKRRQLEYALACLLAEGHLLIEDVPGVGKTTLAKSLANCVDAAFNRVQFTSDLLPSDLIGVTVFHQARGQFEFQQGPIFTNVLLADEINRANPKTQSALLEAMHDAQISHDGITTELPSPFFVVATQNSQDNYGTFPLPESQLDRFLMKIHLGYPEEHFEKRVVCGDYLQDFSVVPEMSLEELRGLQESVKEVHVAEEILDYIYRMMAATRKHPAVKVGVSPRGGQALYRVSQALALIRGRTYVIPDDVLELAEPVFAHRMIYKRGPTDSDGKRVLDEIIPATPAPV